jgi:hypothetical protein
MYSLSRCRSIPRAVGYVSINTAPRTHICISMKSTSYVTGRTKGALAAKCMCVKPTGQYFLMIKRTSSKIVVSCFPVSSSTAGKRVLTKGHDHIKTVIGSKRVRWLGFIKPRTYCISMCNKKECEKLVQNSVRDEAISMIARSGNSTESGWNWAGSQIAQ